VIKGQRLCPQSPLEGRGLSGLKRPNMQTLTKAYPEIEPFQRGRLKVSETHEIYFEQCGNPKGKPVVILHGGPGGGLSPYLRRLHDPARYHMILFDQRGCGQSTPYGSLENNTTWDLVADMEKLRKHLAITRWQLFGGSWGSTLALAYAQMHPNNVSDLILRGIFTVREKEVRWFYQEGASMLFPDAFQSFLAPIPNAERGDLITAYYRRLTGDDEAEKIACAKAWSQWEAATLSLLPDAARINAFGDPRFAIVFASIECHYFQHKGFFPHDGALLDGMSSIAHIPGAIIQGRYDVVTPPQTAFELAARWPEANFRIVPNAGHATAEPGITSALVEATAQFSG
jgi:proline iminopeptidase